MLNLATGMDGAIAADGRISGCYVHGLFSSDAFRAAYLQRIRPGSRAALAYEAGIDATLDALADHLEAHLDLTAMIDG
jgi:adenosylcobyric acid synthase